MQTAIHFEGDQAYICVSDHGKIKEEDPVSYGRSRVEFVIQTAKAQEEGKIELTEEQADLATVEEIFAQLRDEHFNDKIRTGTIVDISGGGIALRNQLVAELAVAAVAQHDRDAGLFGEGVGPLPQKVQ